MSSEQKPKRRRWPTRNELLGWELHLKIEEDCPGKTSPAKLAQWIDDFMYAPSNPGAVHANLSGIPDFLAEFYGVTEQPEYE